MTRTVARHLLLSVALAALAFGCNAKPSPSSSSGAPRRVEVTVDGAGYHPSRIEARAGQPLTLVFRRVTDRTCGTEIAVPSEHVKKSLPLNQAVAVAMHTTHSGAIQFTCGMGMLKGAVVVR